MRDPVPPQLAPAPAPTALGGGGGAWQCLRPWGRGNAYGGPVVSTSRISGSTIGPLALPPWLCASAAASAAPGAAALRVASTGRRHEAWYHDALVKRNVCPPRLGGGRGSFHELWHDHAIHLPCLLYSGTAASLFRGPNPTPIRWSSSRGLPR